MTSVPSVKMGGTMSIYRRIQEHHSIGLIRNELEKIGGGVHKIEACKMKGELYGRYPIHTCVIFEYPEALQELIQRGADVTKRTTGWTSPKHSEGNGKTALCYACELKKLAIMDILLEAGARVLADDRLVCKTIQSSDRDADVSAMKERLDLLLRKGARNPSDVEASVLDAIPLVWVGIPPALALATSIWITRMAGGAKSGPCWSHSYLSALWGLQRPDACAPTVEAIAVSLAQGSLSRWNTEPGGSSPMRNHQSTIGSPDKTVSWRHTAFANLPPSKTSASCWKPRMTSPSFCWITRTTR